MSPAKTAGDDLITLEDCVVGVVPPEVSVELRRSLGTESVLLTDPGETDRFPANQTGVSGAISKIAAAFGDEMRVLDEIEGALTSGSHVLVVPAGDEAEAMETTEILQEHGAGPVWTFGTWTFTRSDPTE
jgi:hypothetical protein